MSIIVTEEDLMNQLLKAVIIILHGHENKNFHQKCECEQGYPSILDTGLLRDSLTHAQIQLAIKIQGPFKNKHFEPVLVCCGFFLTVR